MGGAEIHYTLRFLAVRLVQVTFAVDDNKHIGGCIDAFAQMVEVNEIAKSPRQISEATITAYGFDSMVHQNAYFIVATTGTESCQRINYARLVKLRWVKVGGIDCDGTVGTFKCQRHIFF